MSERSGRTESLRLAIVDHVGNPGGGVRVVRGLVHGLTLQPGLEITYFGNPGAIERDGLRHEFESLKVKVVTLRSLAPKKGMARLAGALARRSSIFAKLFAPLLRTDITREIEQQLNGFDIAYFPWPYLLECPVLECPMVCTVHDLNFKYFFGVHIYNETQIAQLERQLPEWLSRCSPVVSTHFMASEVEKFFPAHASKVKVVHLAAPSTVSMIDAAQAQQRVARLGISSPYILYPTHACSHKNINVLVTAVSLLTKAGRNLELVLTGNGVGRFSGRASEFGLERTTDGADVRSLGYVSNEDMDSLIQCATAVVSPSLYEAGNGPGLDAWASGVPVVMSAIPAFIEHMEVQGVRAKIFNPMDYRELAVRIAEVLDHPEQAKADAEISLRAMQKLSWAKTASGYLEVFSANLQR